MTGNMHKVFVNYTVGGKDYQCGPYREDDADWQRDDVAGYYGVTNVYLSPIRDLKRHLIHADWTVGQT